MLKRKKIRVGEVFGRLEVIDSVSPQRVFCRCSCGKETFVSEYNLYRGKAKSCGCAPKRTATPGLASRNSLYSNYRASATRKNLIFNLTRLEFHELTVQNCHYCGKIPFQKINNKYSGGPYIYNGIDRKDNKVGYIKENCVPCCKRCNTAKSNMSYEEFINYLKNIYSNWLEKFIGITACVETGIEVWSERS